jgi:Zn-dependent protease
MQRNFSFYSKNRRFELHTSSKEIKDILTAWIIISIAFAIVRASGTQSIFSILLTSRFLTLIIISGFTVGLGFLLHEMAHKIVAQRYHCWAEFRADIRMLVLALIMSFFGFVFIAPGAVMIYGQINTRQNGIISMAGPLTNIILAIILIPLLFMNYSSSIITELISSGFLLNAWLGLFNMIPLWNFDGIKIYRWSKIAYFLMLVIAIILVLIFFMK